MAEGARLESVYTFIAYRGFESLSLRHHRGALLQRLFCALVAQLDRALGYELRGREFESLRAHHVIAPRRQDRCAGEMAEWTKALPC